MKFWSMTKRMPAGYGSTSGDEGGGVSMGGDVVRRWGRGGDRGGVAHQ